jgi:hypothetical protein
MATASSIAFKKLGNTVVVAADAAAPTGKQAPVTTAALIAAGNYRIINPSSSVTVFLGTGVDAAAAQASAVAPTAGTPSSALVLIPGTVEVLSFADDVYFSGLAASAVSIYITPGRGM